MASKKSGSGSSNGTKSKSAGRSSNGTASKKASAAKSGGAASRTGSRSSAKAVSKTRKTASASNTSSRGNSNRKGIIASAVDAVTGLFSDDSPNAIELLKGDHRNVEALFDRAKANEDGNNAATFRRIKEELDVHAHIEEQIFYPHLLAKGDKELKKIVREGIEEHGQVKDFLAELSGLSGDSPTFKAKLTVLMEDVEHHVEEEENEMFKMAEDQIPEETLQRLGSLMEAEKARVKKMGGPPEAKRKASAAAK